MSASDLELWQAYTRGVTPMGANRSMMPAPVCQRLPAAPMGHTLDLHGMTLREAYTATSEFLSCHASTAHYRTVTIITGRSGRIHQEFRHWLAAHPVQRVEELYGGGGFRLYLRGPKRSGLR